MLSVEKGGNAVEFDYNLYPRSLDDFPGYDVYCKANLRSMKFAHFQARTNRLYTYLNEFLEMRQKYNDLMQYTENAQTTPKAAQVQIMKLEVAIANPYAKQTEQTC